MGSLIDAMERLCILVISNQQTFNKYLLGPRLCSGVGQTKLVLRAAPSGSRYFGGSLLVLIGSPQDKLGTCEFAFIEK